MKRNKLLLFAILWFTVSWSHILLRRANTMKQGQHLGTKLQTTIICQPKSWDGAFVYENAAKVFGTTFLLSKSPKLPREFATHRDGWNSGYALATKFKMAANT